MLKWHKSSSNVLTNSFDASFPVYGPGSCPLKRKHQWFKSGIQMTIDHHIKSYVKMSTSLPHCCGVSDTVYTHKSPDGSSWNRGPCWCQWSPGPAGGAALAGPGCSPRWTPPHHSPSCPQLYLFLSLFFLLLLHHTNIVHNNRHISQVTKDQRKVNNK